MRYSDDIIEEVRMKNDIVDVISQYPFRSPTTRYTKRIARFFRGKGAIFIANVRSG